MNPSVRRAIICLHISAALYVLCPFLIYFLLSAENETQELELWIVTVIMALFCIGFAVFVEIVILQLKKKKYWSWIASIVLFGLYIPSLFLPLGVIGLVSLVTEEGKRDFASVSR